MPPSKNFQLRIEILDELLGFRKWKKKDLYDRLNERLVGDGYPSVGERIFSYDLSYLETRKGAPLHRPTKAEPNFFYTHSFSIKNTPLNEEEVEVLRKALDLLMNLPSHDLQEDLGAIIGKLRGRIAVNDTLENPVVYFEHETLKLKERLFENIFEAIRNRCVIQIEYKPFHREEAAKLIVSPYFLKEFRKRWFLFGRVENSDRNSIFALDRISNIKNSSRQFVVNDLIDGNTYFKNLVGVTLPTDVNSEKVVFKVSPPTVPYIKTKPIHALQRETKTFKNGFAIFEVELIPNRELKSVFLSYGADIEVLEPDWLREEMKMMVEAMNGRYS